MSDKFVFSASASGPLSPLQGENLSEDQKPQAEVSLNFLQKDSSIQMRVSIVLGRFLSDQFVEIFNEQCLSIQDPLDPAGPRKSRPVTPEEMALIRKDVIDELMRNSLSSRSTGSMYGEVPISGQIRACTASFSRGDFHALAVLGSEGVQREERATLTSGKPDSLAVVIGFLQCLMPDIKAIARKALAQLHPDLDVDVQAARIPDIERSIYDQWTLPFSTSVPPSYISTHLRKF